jgi:hypothetical protein
MIEDTIRRIQRRIESAQSISPQARDEILGLIEELKQEAGELPRDTPADRVQSALSLAEISAHESSRADRDRESPLKEQAFGALQTSIQELEASHPRIAEMIARIANVLSRMGI